MTIKFLKDCLKPAHANFLFGSGLSKPYLSTLGEIEKLILFFALLLTVSMSAFAQEDIIEYHGLRYHITSGNTVEVVSSPFNGSELIIPEKVINEISQEEYTVTGIRDTAFLNNRSITSVSIPATVKNHRRKCFQELR